jgi:hypothetical protein
MIQSRLKKGEESKGLERRNMVGSARAVVKTVDQSGFWGRSLPAAIPRPKCTGSRGVLRLFHRFETSFRARNVSGGRL